VDNGSVQVSIGKQWKDVLDYNENLGYLVHVSCLSNLCSKLLLQIDHEEQFVRGDGMLYTGPQMWTLMQSDSFNS
jgi:hypothetical protein